VNESQDSRPEIRSRIALRVFVIAAAVMAVMFVGSVAVANAAGPVIVTPADGAALNFQTKGNP
jgi:hypothetical protein